MRRARSPPTRDASLLALGSSLVVENQGAPWSVVPTAQRDGAYRDRTGDPQLAKLVLSQLS